MKQVTDMTKGSPAKLILTFALPLILTNIGQQLYMVVDSSIVGRGVGLKALAAVGSADWTYWLILWTIQGLTQGFAIFISRYFGKQDYRNVNKTIAMSTILCGIIGVILTIIGLFVAKPILLLLKTPSDIIGNATTYLMTMIAGTLIVIAYNMAASVLRSFGDGKTPLIAMLIAAFLNVGLDLLFVLVFHWGVFGAAIASVIAQLISFLFCLVGIRKIQYVKFEKSDGIKTEARYTTINELYELWKVLKRGLKDNTFENYQYMYDTFVRPKIGQQRISTFKKSDVKRYYNYLADERGLKASTIDSIHTVLHQILEMAVDDDYIRNNPSDNVLRELKQSHVFKTEKRRGLTRPEQDLFLDYLKNTPKAQNWYPIFAVMLGTGLRVGEVTGLRWCDIDLEEGIIDINHTLVYYDHRASEGKKGCYFNVNTPKTEAGNRQVPMLDFVKEAFLMEKERQEMFDLHCEVTIDGYRDFIFINRFGQTQHQSTLNKAIRRIIRDCNDEQLLKDTNAKVLLPHFSCHSLRHTFTTRMCEAGVNVKVIQDALGHKDISTTLNIYTDVTKELKRSEFEGLDLYFKNE